MDGCSFGAGSETPSHARLVSHVNVSRPSTDVTGFTAQKRQQEDLLHDATADARILGADRYSPLGSEQSGTTFGVRDRHGVWKFHCLIYRSRPYVWVGVIDV